MQTLNGISSKAGEHRVIEIHYLRMQTESDASYEYMQVCSNKHLTAQHQRNKNQGQNHFEIAASRHLVQSVTQHIASLSPGLK